MLVFPHDKTILLGAFNATVRDDMGFWCGTIVVFFPEHLNYNGLCLLEQCRSHDLIIANIIAISTQKYPPVHMVKQ